MGCCACAPQGGATRFDHLGLSAQPRKGTLLVFFPGFADGLPDSRTLHCAEDAVDPKWVMQQWVSSGVAAAPAAQATRPAAAGALDLLERRGRGKGRKGGKAAQPKQPAKGFGAR